MIRSTKHILKFSTMKKQEFINSMLDDFQDLVQYYIKLVLKDQLPLKKYLSSKLLPSYNTIAGGQWKQLAYKQASSIIRSQLDRAKSRRYKHYKKIYHKAKKQGKRISFINKKYSKLRIKPLIHSKFFTLPKLNSISIDLDDRFFNISFDSNHFDEFVSVATPYIKEGYKNQRIKVNLPIKHYKYSNKYRNDPFWERKSTIRLRRNKQGQLFLDIIYYKPEPSKKSYGKPLGIDQGYKKMIADSNGNVYGAHLENLYNKIVNKKQGSKAFKRLLIHRDNEINRICNKLEIYDVNEIIIEDLKNVKKNSKQNKKTNSKFMNKLQRWSYCKTIDKLERLCEENGVLLTKVNPAYTSQTCSSCGCVDKSSRKGELYKCQHCGYVNDADVNAAINILRTGVYSPCGPINKLH